VQGESGGEGGPDQDGEDGKMSVTAHGQIGTTRDEPTEYGE
jgi:hypothetical protein